MEGLILTERFAEALAYAARVHQLQWRKSTHIPYISHLMAVSAIVLEHGGNEDEAIAALLHDAPEDQGGQERLDDIRRRFGDNVADIVAACSDSLSADPTTKLDWPTRKANYHHHLREHYDASVYLVSAADKLHNARATCADGPGVWQRFNATREQSIANYKTLVSIYMMSTDERVTAVASKLKEVVSRL